MSNIHPLDKLRQGLSGALKATITDLKKSISETEAQHAELQARELKKSEGLCKDCGKAHPLEKCGEMKVAKGEKEMVTKTLPDKPAPKSVLPDDKKPKDISDKDTGAGGQIKKMHKAAMKLSKATPADMLAAFAGAQGQASIAKAVAPQPAAAPAGGGVQVSPQGGAACAHCQRFYPVEEQQGMAEARAQNCPCDANVQATLQKMRIAPMTKSIPTAPRPGDPAPHDGGKGWPTQIKGNPAAMIPGLPPKRHDERPAPAEGGGRNRAADHPKFKENFLPAQSGQEQPTRSPSAASRATYAQDAAKFGTYGPGMLGKADVPMAKPPSGKVPGPAAPSVSKPTAPSAPMVKEEVNLAKAGPKLGGKDPLSQGMTNDAAKAAMGSAPPKIPGVAPKLSQEDQARRSAEMAAFTPAGAFGEPKGQGAVAGAMKPAALPPSGLELAPKTPKPALGGAAPAKPKIPGRP